MRFITDERRIENADQTKIAFDSAHFMTVVLIEDVDGSGLNGVRVAGGEVDDFSHSCETVVSLNVMLVLQFEFSSFGDRGVMDRKTPRYRSRR
jgi:hypothetical protein